MRFFERGNVALVVGNENDTMRHSIREYLTENLQRSHGNVTEAARVAKRHRSDFYTLLTRFRLKAHDFKTPGPEVPANDPPE